MVRRVDDVLERMREIESMLPRRDGIAVFNGVYREMSEQLRDRMRDGLERTHHHDLAIAVVTTCGRMRREPMTMHDDYERINDVIASVVRPIRQSFLDSLVVEAGAPLSPLADLVSNWSIDKARDAAWVHARTLWELRKIRTFTGAYRRTLGRTVGLIGRQLLVA